MSGIELLHEAPGLPAFELPDELRERYGGSLGFDEPRLVANFVGSLDGVVAAPPLVQSARLISADNDSDRFVMSLLRACADAIVIGSGTLRASPRSLWTADGPYPAAAGAFAELRRRRRRPENPALVVLTGSGLVDPAHPAFARGALVLTTDGGAVRLEGRLPGRSEIVSLGAAPAVDLGAALRLLRARGHRLILSEAGPHVFGGLLAAGLVDELFLTVSPVVAGRAEDAARLGLVEAHDLLAGGGAAARLLSVRRDGGHLFLRYGLSRPGRAEPSAEP
ncbi:Pyrimidine reductase riboflavin biosynthesis [Gaiella occulta]|uniref:Pyrimidine reductase riboflavin biosynthesis n=1 Tax=Gaiella occulta TaxID=1002870 RepID=A0A7M2Z2K7_9ACTN|nr:dihydrofolate reductase family protein [Gaiella occulta]RDI76232.1 Pyrimidine reductase riboflavin biosynthesis [Gaiella occulta]